MTITSLSLVGTYSRNPVETPFHRVSIQCDEDGNLIWNNEAEQTWQLRLEDTVLFLNETCPHFADGVSQVLIQAEGDRVIGLEFMGEMYTPDGVEILVSLPALQERLEGRYERRPVEEEKHVVNLDYDNDSGLLTWRNDAGESWSLSISEDKGSLRIGEESPYFSEGGTEATIVTEGDKVVSLGFMGETYTKTNVVGEDESEGAVAFEDDFGLDDEDAGVAL